MSAENIMKWTDHVKSVAKRHGITYGEAMKKAKSTWKKAAGSSKPKKSQMAGEGKKKRKPRKTKIVALAGAMRKHPGWVHSAVQQGAAN